MDEKKRCVELARDLITSYFDSLSNRELLNGTGFVEAFAVRTEDSVLLEHVKAWINILTEAKEVLEENNEK